MQQTKSISQEEGDIPDKAEREKEKNALLAIQLTLAMMFLRLFVDMMKVNPKDLDCAKTGAIG